MLLGPWIAQLVGGSYDCSVRLAKHPNHSAEVDALGGEARGPCPVACDNIYFEYKMMWVSQLDITLCYPEWSSKSLQAALGIQHVCFNLSSKCPPIASVH